MRNIPTITKNLLIINVLMFLALFVFMRLGTDLNDVLGLHFFLTSDFHVYQLFTYMFMHGGFSHIFFNMFALWMFGRIVETQWGPKRFLTYYLTCGVGAGLIQMAAQFISFYITMSAAVPGFGMDDVMTAVHANELALSTWTTVGASGAIYGILLAFGMLFPEERIFVFPLPVPIKAKWFVIIYAAIELFLGVEMPGDSVAHFAHLGGMIFGYFLIRHWQRHPFGGGYGGYGNYGGYGRNSAGGKSLTDRLKDWLQGFTKKNSRRKSPFDSVTRGGSRETDWEYNARKKKEQEEIDHILDKIRKSGYDSLTPEEKQKLFDKSKE